MSDDKIGSIVPLTEDSKEARLVYALKNLNSTISERDALAADNARLRKALERSITALVFADTPESKAFHFGDLVAELRETIAATPAQSLAAHDAALLRKIAIKFRGDSAKYWDITYGAAAVHLEAEAQARANEASNG